MHKYFGEILAGKRVIITGANRGLGLLMARRFLECGAKVAICCAPQEEYEEAVEKLQALDPSYSVKGFRPNLTDEEELNAMIANIEADWGGIDILINNAGLYPACVFDEYPKDLFKTVFDVNVTGTFVTSQCVARAIEKQGGGVIINTSSMAGIDGAMRNIGYTASKFAVEGLTLGMARELGPKNIRVNAVAPAGIKTVDFDGNEELHNMPTMTEEMAAKMVEASKLAAKFAPMGRFMVHPDELINAFIFLASDAASFVSGQTIAVSGACIWPAASPASTADYDK